MFCSLCVAQETKPACDNACLVAAMNRLQVTIAEHNQLMAEQIRLATPQPLTKRQRTMKIVQAVGQFAIVATPIIIKTVQPNNPVKK